MTKRSTTISVIINDGGDFLMNAIIFHGSAPHATADKFWYKNIAHSLNSLGISTIVADLPKLTILSIVMKSKEEVYLTIWVEHLF